MKKAKCCPNCGKIFSEDINFCIDCGSKLSPHYTPTKNRKLVLSLFILFVAIISVISISEGLKANKARESIENYKIDKYLSEPTTLDIKIANWDWHIDDGYVYIKGSVNNVSDKTISYYKITAEFLDSGGNVVDTDWTNNDDTLSPNASNTFDMMHKEDINFQKISLKITEIS